LFPKADAKVGHFSTTSKPF
jgi:hypothetical protein